MQENNGTAIYNIYGSAKFLPELSYELNGIKLYNLADLYKKVYR